MDQSPLSFEDDRNHRKPTSRTVDDVVPSSASYGHVQEPPVQNHNAVAAPEPQPAPSAPPPQKQPVQEESVWAEDRGKARSPIPPKPPAGYTASRLTTLYEGDDVPDVARMARRFESDAPAAPLHATPPAPASEPAPAAPVQAQATPPSQREDSVSPPPARDVGYRDDSHSEGTPSVPLTRRAYFQGISGTKTAEAEDQHDAPRDRPLTGHAAAPVTPSEPESPIYIQADEPMSPPSAEETVAAHVHAQAALPHEDLRHVSYEAPAFEETPIAKKETQRSEPGIPQQDDHTAAAPTDDHQEEPRVSVPATRSAVPTKEENLPVPRGRFMRTPPKSAGRSSSDDVIAMPDDQAPRNVKGELVEEGKFTKQTKRHDENLPATKGKGVRRASVGGDVVFGDEDSIDGTGGAGAKGPTGRLGDRLIERGYLTEDQLKVALQEKKITGKMLGQILVELEFITDAQLSEVLADAAGYQVFDAKNTIVDGEALAILSRDQASKMQVLPISFMNGEFSIAMVDPHDVVTMDKIRRALPKNTIIKPFLTSPSTVAEAIDAAYGYASDVESILAEMEAANADELARLPEQEVYTHPIVRLVNALVAEAVKLGVSDLHWEPEENFIRLRYRLDGVLYTAQMMHKKHWSAIAQRIKIMSDMNIADKLSPQDGRFELKFGPRSADFRVSVLPTVFGENIVMRVLDKSSSIMPLEKLGFSEHNLGKIKWAQSRPEGIIIVTGPTGSGKSTSLYSMINAINSVEVDIQTLEDPVEYPLPMIRQTAVREGVLGFGDGIRALLRQDPDIIFIGEIRDGTTAEMALKAAMTGHQVYTTLHTNDSFGALPRLIDLGLKPGMIAGSIIAVFAQRLARRLCSCKEAYQPDSALCKILGYDANDPPTIHRPREGGCHLCRGQGYKGRIALAEILTFDDELDEILARGGTKQELKKKAIEKGFKSMKDDAILKIREGITSYESAATCVDFSR